MMMKPDGPRTKPDLAHWNLTPIPTGAHFSIRDARLAPDSPYKVRFVVTPIPINKPTKYGFMVSVSNDDPNAPIGGLTANMFPDDTTDWKDFPTRDEACQAADDWLERNREQIVVVAERYIRRAKRRLR